MKDKYSKLDIINEADENNFFQYDLKQKTVRKKLNRMIDDLKETTKINWSGKEKNDFAISYYNLDYSPENSYEPYDYNIPTYLLIVLSLENYEDLAFKKALQNDDIATSEGEALMRKIEKSLYSNYGKLLQYYCSTNDLDFYTVAINILSLFYIILVDRDLSKEDKIDREIIKTCIMMLALPEEQKTKIYHGPIKNRLEYIKNKIIDEYNENMDNADKSIYEMKKIALEELLDNIIY